MSFDGIQVQHAKLVQGAADMLKSAKDIQARLDQLEDELNSLKSNWHGAAQEAYREAKLRWDTAMSEMILLLEDAGRGVEAANMAYQAADARGRDKF